MLFDLGRVLIDFDHGISAGKIAALTRRPVGDIYDFFFASALVQDFEAGKIAPEYFFFRVRDALDLEIGFGEFAEIWNDIFFIRPHNRRVYELARRLRRTHIVALLSNVNLLHFQYLRRRFPVFDVFDYIFASYEMGCVKPDPRIYALALEALGCAPQEVFYTDDRPELIAAASGLGIRSFVYSGIARLEADLASCGIAAAGDRGR